MGTTIQDVIDMIIATILGAPLEDTVDIIKTGDSTQAVNGIVTTFLATSEVINKAIELGANLIITHEPTFYEHLDETEWLQSDPVYQAKRRLIDDHGIVIWRFHDYWHRHRPDGLLDGLLIDLGWEFQIDFETLDEIGTNLESFEDFWRAIKATCSFNMPPISLLDLAEVFKQKLDIQRVRVVGNPDMICSRAAVVVGKLGGNFQIKILGEDDIDVLICGEINEWETCEYVRDATYHNQEKGLIILGYANSEESGMKWCAEWLRSLFPGVSITHVPAGDPFRFV